MSENLTIGTNANLLVNSSLTLLCPSDGEPKPKIEWMILRKPDGWLQRQKHITISKDGSTLTISLMTKSLAGVYHCTAKNVFGSHLARSALSVKDIQPPTITFSSKKLVVRRETRRVTTLVGGELFVRPNTQVLIHCPVRGSPKPSVKWLKDGKEIPVDILSPRNTLELRNVELSHEGTYTCVAESVLRTVKKATKLVIGMRPTIPSVEPQLSPIVSITAYSEVTIPIGVETARVRSGSSVAFQCHGKGYPVPNISWFRNGIAIELPITKVNKYQSLIPQVLEVKKLAPEDAGTYSCMVKNVFGDTIKNTKLEILEPPVIHMTKSNITFNPSTDHVKISVGGGTIVLKGASVSLRCPTTGKPFPTIKWTKLKQNTSFFSDLRFRLTRDKQLTIQNIQTKDSGKYVCTASNVVASASSFVRLLVADKPNAVILPNYRGEGREKSVGVIDSKGRLIVPAGKPIRLACRITGSPTPRITWLKDHKIVRASAKYQVSKGLLEVNYADENDAGTYVCMVENLLGVTTVPAEVLIGAPPSISKIRYEKKSKDGMLIEASAGSHLNVRSQSTVKLYCNATGVPTPMITWERSGYDPRRGTVVSQVMSYSGMLTLNGLSAKTAGNMTCTAKNVIGVDKVESSVKVLDSPKIIPDVEIPSLRNTKFYLIGKDKEVDIIEGERVILVCVSQGIPPPNILFSHPRQKLSGEEMFEMLQNLEGNSASTVEEVLFSHTRQLKQSLKSELVLINGMRNMAMVARATIHSVGQRHKGTYSCKARNAAGEDEDQIKFVIHPKPTGRYNGRWIVSEYGECGTPCVRVDYGAQQRNVTCLLPGGRKARGAYCGLRLKPKESRECPTMQCTTMWKTGMWSECSATCGYDGVQERIPYCIYSKWKVSTHASNCAKLKDKPVVKRHCNKFPCSEDKCIDKYNYCKFMKKMGFCRLQKYKAICCSSCTGSKK